MDSAQQDNGLVGIQQAARTLGVSTRTLKRWEIAGVVNPYRTPSNQRRYTQADIDRLLNRDSDSSDHSRLHRGVAKALSLLLIFLLLAALFGASRYVLDAYNTDLDT